MRAADRMENVTYAIRDVNVRAKEIDREDFLHLNIGDPLKFDFATPAHMIEAVEEAMREQRNSYGPAEGMEAARKSVAREMERRTGSSIAPDHVLLGSGVSEIIQFALTALLNPGENVLTPTPGYPQYTALINLLGGELNEYACDEENGWNPDMEEMRAQINDKTRAIVVINPNNPTGAVYKKNTVQEIVDLAGEHDIPVLADEIYAKLSYGTEHVPVASLAEDVPVLTFNGISKSYLAPGWRTGWAALHDPEEKMGEIWSEMQQLARVRLSANFPMQHAITAALEGPQDHLKPTRDTLENRANIIHERMNAIDGLSVVRPRGAFYAFVKIEDAVMQHFDSDRDFVYELMRETGVVTVFGSGFGSGPAEDHFRIVFLPEEETLETACEKITDFVNGI